MKYPDMLNSRATSQETPYKAITGTMKEFVLKFKKKETIPIDGIDLWTKIMYSLEKDDDCDVKQAVRKLLGLDRDRYAEIHGRKKGRS